MNTHQKHRICPVGLAGTLDLKLRKLFQNPQKILSPYIKEGMTVVDLGCGPGFFSIEMAKMTGASGKVIAADLQEGMLNKVKNKIRNSNLETIIHLHHCQEDRINLKVTADFILIFYMLHEVPGQLSFLQEVRTMMKSDARILIAEPKFHVSKKSFASLVENIKKAGFKIIEEPKILFSRAMIIINDSSLRM